MRIEVVTPPTVEPVSLAEAKVHLRLDPATAHPEDALIEEWIISARERVETEVGRALATRTLDVYYDAFPCGGGFLLRDIRQFGWGHPDFMPRSQALSIPLPPLQSVTSVKYLDAAGVLQVLDPARYRVVPATNRPGRVEPVLNGEWPETAPLSDAVVVRVVAGYGLASAVPASAKSAIKLLLGHKNEHREAVLVGESAAELPRGVRDTLNPLRWGRYS